MKAAVLLVTALSIAAGQLGCSSAADQRDARKQTVPAAGSAGSDPAGRDGDPRVEPTARPVVLMETSLGPLKIELRPDKAPLTVRNFLRYVDDGFYDGTIFHRVIDGFMIQGGGFTPQMDQKKTYGPIPNEASAEMKNLLGTVAMARTDVVDSATAQFFISVADNAFLDHRDRTPAGFGYAVFGRVIEGMDVARAIAKTATRTAGGFENVPVEPVIIRSVRLAK